MRKDPYWPNLGHVLTQDQNTVFQSTLLDVVTHLSSPINYGQELGLPTRSFCSKKMGIFQKKEGWNVKSTKPKMLTPNIIQAIKAHKCNYHFNKQSYNCNAKAHMPG